MTQKRERDRRGEEGPGKGRREGSVQRPDAGGSHKRLANVIRRSRGSPSLCPNDEPVQTTLDNLTPLSLTSQAIAARHCILAPMLGDSEVGEKRSWLTHSGGFFQLFGFGYLLVAKSPGDTRDGPFSRHATKESLVLQGNRSVCPAELAADSRRGRM